MKYLKKYEELVNLSIDDVNLPVKNVTLDDVLNDCSIFINDLKKYEKGSFFVRGINDRNIDIQKTKTDWDRIPVDTSTICHKILNDLFEKKFGWKVRNGVFCYPNSFVGKTNKQYDPSIKYRSNYGTKTYFIFPVDGYKFAYDENVNDLYDKIEMTVDRRSEFGDEEDYIDCIYPYLRWVSSQFVECELNNLLPYNIFDLKLSYNPEISVKCDEYYLVDISHLDELIKRIWK